MKRTLILLSLVAATFTWLSVSARASFADPYTEPSIDEGPVMTIPAGCDVEDWCLIKSTECKLVFDAHPNGLYRSTVRYSVVRRANIACSGYYGTERRVITGPVEPVYFQSTVQGSWSAARSEAFGLCRSYREDWVSLAPECPAR